MFETAQQLCDALSAPFATSDVDWRIGQAFTQEMMAKALCYIDARVAMDRLDAICGPGGWQCNYSSGVNGSIVCNLGIHMPDAGWIWKADGAGATDIEGEKGALSDAFKRAAVRFGLGRYLYTLDSPRVGIEQWGRSYRILDSERAKLDEAHDKGAQRFGWGGPTEVAAYRFLVRVVEETVTQPHDVEIFRDKYKSMFPLLRVAMRRHLENRLDTIGAQQREAAE